LESAKINTLININEKESMKKYLNQGTLLVFALILGLMAGWANVKEFDLTAQVISGLFMNLLKLVSLPIIFLSIVSTASGMESASEIKAVGRKVVTYTLLTTVIAASVALGMFVLINPVNRDLAHEGIAVAEAGIGGYFEHLIHVIPSNIVRPFVENNVIGVLFIAILLSLAIISLPDQKRKEMHSFFSSLYAAIMKITGWVISLMPLAIWSFVTLFIKDLREGLEIKSIALYLICIIGANLIQGFVVLPILLRIKGISAIQYLKEVYPALSVAFFSKSSNAALPLAMKCAVDNGKVAPKIANFSLPLCTTINMNGCAAFILVTVLFVSMSHGVVYSPYEMLLWIIIATIAAVGNAGVPMGCYFLASAFLAATNVPLNILGFILPFYSLIDMLETAINV